MFGTIRNYQRANPEVLNNNRVERRTPIEQDLDPALDRRIVEERRTEDLCPPVAPPQRRGVDRGGPGQKADSGTSIRALSVASAMARSALSFGSTLRAKN